MTAFNSIITAFCAAGICFGAIFIICPNGRIEKSVKYVISLCFLLIIISFAGINADFEKFDIDFSANTPDTEELETTTAEYTIGVALQKANIDFKEISVYVDNSEIEGISCTRVEIYTNCDKQKIIEILGSENESFKVEVINE